MEGKRTIRVEGGKRTDTAFEFPMILATGGEASDGHILNIRGGVVPERMPLLVSHVNDPLRTAGSVIGATKQLRKSPAELRAVGQIELDGKGEGQEFRQDLAHMIEAGHVGAVSIRWQGEKAIPRRDLPKSHPAHVREDEPDSNRRFGVFFEEWRALEGSVVAIGADSAAVIGAGRSEAWADFLKETEEYDPGDLERVASLTALAIEAARDMMITPEEIGNQFRELYPEAFAVETHRSAPEPEEAAPSPAPSVPAQEASPAVEVFGEKDLERLLAEHESRLRGSLESVMDRALGRITR